MSHPDTLTASEQESLFLFKKDLEQKLYDTRRNPPSMSLSGFQDLVNECVDTSPEDIKRYLVVSYPDPETYGSLNALLRAIKMNRNEDRAARYDFDGGIYDLDETSQAVVRNIESRFNDVRKAIHNTNVTRTFGDVMDGVIGPGMRIPSDVAGPNERFYNPSGRSEFVVSKALEHAQERISMRLDTTGMNQKFATLADELARYVAKTPCFKELSNYTDIADAVKNAAFESRKVLGKSRPARENDESSLDA